MIMIHVISMPHVSIMLVAMTVNVCQVSWEMDSIVQVSILNSSILYHLSRNCVFGISGVLSAPAC